MLTKILAQIKGGIYMERININSVNYVAICLLQKFGNTEPTQQQINLVELLILLGFRPRLINLKKIEGALPSNDIIKYVIRKYRKMLNKNNGKNCSCCMTKKNTTAIRKSVR